MSNIKEQIMFELDLDIVWTDENSVRIPKAAYAKLKEPHNAAMRLIKRYRTERDAAYKKMKRLRTALEWYRDESNWAPAMEYVESIAVGFGSSPVYDDGGWRALQALKEDK